MRDRVGGSGDRLRTLDEGWEMAAAPAGASLDPSEASATLVWQAALVPGTVAGSLRAAGAWTMDGPTRAFDDEEWWYRLRFRADPVEDDEEVLLRFDGLATVAEAWLNGHAVLRSSSMFVARECCVEQQLRERNELILRFAPLNDLLGERRPRGRWRVPMIDQQRLRWFRTTLLGRTPGWSPPACPVGPWRPIHLLRGPGAPVDDIRTSADADGRFTVSCRVDVGADSTVEAELSLERDGQRYTTILGRDDDRLSGALVVPDVALWWPHTHGQPALYDASLHLTVDGRRTHVELGGVGFRTVTVDTEDGDFRVRVNGVPVFCRGACWTPLDPVGLTSDPEALDRAFDQVVDAGMNMLRVLGTGVYESDAFLDRCDRRGVLLWQDLMFANMDYPDDPDFQASISEEVRQQLARLQGRPSLCVVCGNSEAGQQAAMASAPRDRWAPTLFHDHLAGLTAEACPGVAYWPSSAHGGAFPHQADVGTTSYFGVGAYLRPLEDARRADVRFASECLAFANVPEPDGVASMPDGYGSRVHRPGWKARTPRDSGAGWDFDDVRDHYVGRLFDVDPVALRSSDHERYLALGRVATGEVMGSVFSEWRRGGSRTRGGLVLLFRDLWQGAGWGVVDASGRPKAAWYHLRRALAPRTVLMTDEGTNGLALHVVNDAPDPLEARLDLSLYRGSVPVGQAGTDLSLPAHSTHETNAAALFDFWMDLTWAHRFGPPSHDVAVATLRSGAAVLGQAFHFPIGLPARREAELGLSGTLRPGVDGSWEATLRTERFAQSVRIEVEGFEPLDNYLHLAPGGERHTRLRPLGNDRTPPRGGALHALNAETSAPLVVL